MPWAARRLRQFGPLALAPIQAAGPLAHRWFSLDTLRAVRLLGGLGHRVHAAGRRTRFGQPDVVLLKTESLEDRRLLSLLGPAMVDQPAWFQAATQASPAISEAQMVPDAFRVSAQSFDELPDTNSLAQQATSALESTPFGADWHDTSEFMLGDVWVTVVLMESDGTIDPQTENWTTSEIDRVKSEIRTGLDWWQQTLAQAPAAPTRHHLHFQIDYTYADNPVPTGYEPINRSQLEEDLWIKSFLTHVGYSVSSGYQTAMKKWDHQQRIDHATDWAFTLFVIDSSSDTDGKFADGKYFAYAYLGGPFGVMTYDNDGWGIDRMDRVTAHEVGHIFYALDEYPGESSYYDHSGYYNTQNLNATDAHPNPTSRVASIMAEAVLQEQAWNQHSSSPTSLEMIGWRDSNGDGIFDVADVPLQLTGSGRYNVTTSQYEFTGSSSVKTLANQNPNGSHHNITLNTVDRVQYRWDAGAWIDGNAYGTYTANISQSVPFPAGAHTIEFRTVVDETGLGSSIWSPTGLPTVYGTIWEDLDADGTHNEGEPVLPDWTVFLDANRNGLFDQAIDTAASSDANGRFSFANLPPGEYALAQLRTAGWRQTLPAASAVYEFTLADGGLARLDFGNRKESTVVHRYVFYNHSAFDGRDDEANSADDHAIAPNKTALLLGQTAAFANYTSYSRGINGIMIDIVGLARMPSQSDFDFRVGNDDHPNAWLPATPPTSITVRPGAGVDGADRVTLIWPNGAIQNQWLQVTLLANANTGLIQNDVFCFGNAVGEAGDSPTDAAVTAIDLLLARNHPRTFLNPAPIDDPYDFDRNAHVGAVDVLLARNNATNALTALKLIDLSSGLPQELLVNGGFESGDFSGWTATASGQPELTPWTVSKAGSGFFYDSHPFTGQYSALNGFDGMAGLTYELHQDFVVPLETTRLQLTTHHRLVYTSASSSQARKLTISLRDTNNALITVLYSEAIPAGALSQTDRGWNTQVFDIPAVAGQTLRLSFQQSIAEDFAGPAMIEFDDIRLTAWVRGGDPPQALLPGARAQSPRGAKPPKSTSHLVSQIPV